MKLYTEDQIRQAGKDAEMSIIDVEYLISVLTHPDKLQEAKEDNTKINWVDKSVPFQGPVFTDSLAYHSKFTEEDELRKLNPRNITIDTCEACNKKAQDMLYAQRKDGGPVMKYCDSCIGRLGLQINTKELLPGDTNSKEKSSET